MNTGGQEVAANGSLCTVQDKVICWLGYDEILKMNLSSSFKNNLVKKRFSEANSAILLFL